MCTILKRLILKNGGSISLFANYVSFDYALAIYLNSFLQKFGFETEKMKKEEKEMVRA